LAEFLEHFQRGQLISPLDPADVGEVHPSGDPTSQRALGEPPLEPETPKTFADRCLDRALANTSASPSNPTAPTSIGQNPSPVRRT
jgi:hypothetical protein